MKKLPGIFRDVHPDCEPVNFGRYRGQVYVKDLPSDLMARCRRAAGAKGQPLKKVLRIMLRAAVAMMDESKGGAS